MRAFPIVVVLFLVAAPALSQELEPRAYAASPVGANFLVAAYGYNWGPVVLDPSIPIADVDAHVHILTPGYGRTFGLFGLQSLITAALPLVRGHVKGTVMESDSEVTRTGIGDLRAKLSLNLIGGRALRPAEFASRPRPKWIAGTSLTVSAPTGQYFPDKLINIGTNRWAFKPEIGVSSRWGEKVYLEGYAGVWLYTANHSLYPGSSTREQRPLTSLQAHASYTFRARDWVALDYTWYSGGATSTNDGPETGRLSNSRIGITGSVGLDAKQSLKLNASTGASGRVGSKFRAVTLAYQRTWF
jgi:outer membrane putative beta-barrel porin/alpha-amylase